MRNGRSARRSISDGLGQVRRESTSSLSRKTSLSRLEAARLRLLSAGATELGFLPVLLSLVLSELLSLPPPKSLARCENTQTTQSSAQTLNSTSSSRRHWKPGRASFGHLMLVDFDLSKKISTKSPRNGLPTPSRAPEDRRSSEKQISAKTKNKKRILPFLLPQPPHSVVELFHCPAAAGDDSVDSSAGSRQSDSPTAKSNSFVGATTIPLSFVHPPENRELSGALPPSSPSPPSTPPISTPTADPPSYTRSLRPAAPGASSSSPWLGNDVTFS